MLLDYNVDEEVAYDLLTAKVGKGGYHGGISQQAGHRHKRRYFADTFHAFLESGEDVARMIMDEDDIARNVAPSATWMAKYYGLPIKARIRKGEVYLVRTDI